jgi:hypothetical protein
MNRVLVGLVVLLAAATLALSGCGTRKAATGSTGGATGAVSAHGTLGAGAGAGSPAPDGGAPAAGMPMGAPIAAQTGGSPHAAAGLTWTVPADWGLQGERQMRVATYSIPAAPGDEGGAECAVFYFGANQGGGVDANVERWIGQFQPATHSQRSAGRVNGLAVSRVEVTGTYTSPAGPMMQSQGSKAGWRLLGAIVEGPRGAVFFKLTGPAKTVATTRAHFDALLASVKRE